MPGRPTPLVTDQIYHVFNRGIDRRPTFTNKKEFQRAIATMNFYRLPSRGVKLSRLLTLDEKKKMKVLDFLNKSNPLVEILAFCLMPNHYHFLLKQKVDGGISKFISIFQNSYTRYFNTSHKRDGALFLNLFKAVLIETDEQLIHISRYIHLNPYSSHILKSISDLETYPWSSFSNYIEDNHSFVVSKPVLSLFSSKTSYKQFVLDQADYQKQLKIIAHLTID